MKDIKLYNRDGADLRLVSEDGKLWGLQVDDKHKYILEYMRVGYTIDNVIDMIDPSGGPYLNLGMRLDKIHVIDFILEVDGEFKIHTYKKEL